MEFTLNDETAADVLIFWIESSDGSISYWEDEAVREALSKMDYNMRTYRDTIIHLGALSTERLEEIIKEAREYVKTNYTNGQKKDLIDLLVTIAGADSNAGKIEQEKLQNLQDELGV